MEPLAIIGFSFIFPDDVKSSDSLWSMLIDRKCASKPWPKDRLSGTALYHPDGDRYDSVPVPGGHFITEDISAFDASFFRLSAAEAAAMDPQQRMLLETSFRAFENAGLSLDKISGSNTSVYTGCFTDDYKTQYAKDPEEGSKYAVVGISSSMLSGRVSWFYNLKGPSMTVDTACSSSLVAFDLGCQSLRSKSADMSLVTGCNLIFTPDATHVLSGMSMLSPHGKSYSFDHRANGYGRGEGISALVLKRLSDAVRDGDTIRAVIRSSAVNSDGRTPGITQPNAYSQEALIREAYARANLDMSCTRYIEAHGTGTPVGDPLEAKAVGAAFKEVRKDNDPIYIGAIKSNIGHVEGAAGLASIIKTILVLEKGIIPPNTNFESINPNINGKALGIKIPTNPVPWPLQGLRRASINSFGASGTNVHVVLDDAYHYLSQQGIKANHCTKPLSSLQSQMDSAVLVNGHQTPCPEHETDSRAARSYLLIISAAKQESLADSLKVYQKYFTKLRECGEGDSKFLCNLAYTLDTRRSLFSWRSYLVIEENVTSSQTLVNMSKPTRAAARARVAFVFTGQGASWPQMGQELLVYPIFRDSLKSADDHLCSLGCSWSLLEELSREKDSSRVENVELSQAACTAVQVALVDLLWSFQMEPVAVIGHSSGEIAAAYCAGVFTREAAWEIAFFRGRLSDTLAEQNCTMMAVGLGKDQVELFIQQVGEQFPSLDLSIACINSPRNITVSGQADQVLALKALLDERNIFARKLKINVAYHSHHMKAIAADYKSNILNITSSTKMKNSPTMISTVTGKEILGDYLCNPDYWVRNLVSPVLFSSALRRLCISLDVSTIVEVGPHSALRSPIKETLQELPNGPKIGYHSCLLRNTSASKSLFETLGSLFCTGVSLDVRRVNEIEECPGALMALSDLPEYSFDHSKTFWKEGRLSKESRFRKHFRLDLLGKPVVDYNPLEPRWRNFLKYSEILWVKSHEIDGTVIYPAAGMLVMAIEAASQVADHTRQINGFQINDAQFYNALRIPPTAEGIETQFQLRLHQNATGISLAADFNLYAYEEGHWISIGQGKIHVIYCQEENEVYGSREVNAQTRLHRHVYEETLKACGPLVSKKEFYRRMWDLGYTFGPDFCVLDEVRPTEDRRAIGTVKCYTWPSDGIKNRPQQHIVHPITLDGFIQAAMAAYSHAAEDQVPTMVPRSVETLWISNSGLSFPDTERLQVRAEIQSADNLGFVGSFTGFSSDLSRIVAKASGLKTRFVVGATAQSTTHCPKQMCFGLSWMPDIELLSTSNIASFCQNSLTTASSAVPDYRSLAKYIDALGFKNPQMNILQINSGCGEATYSLLQQIMSLRPSTASTTRYGKWCVTNPSSVNLEKAESVLGKFDNMEFKQLNIQTDRAFLEELGSFDLIIGSNIQDYRAFLASTRSLVKPSGKVILIGAKPQSTGTIEIRSKDPLSCSFLKENLFSDQVVELCGKESNTNIFAAIPSTCDGPHRGRWLLLVDPSIELQLETAQKVQSALRALPHDANVEITALEGLAGATYLSDVVLISFLELEQPVFNDLSSSTFDTLRKALPNLKGVLWLTGGGGSFGGSPDYAVVEGLSRVVRLENERLKFVTAKLEKTLHSIEYQAHTVLDIVGASRFHSTNQDYESTYLQINGQMFVNRILGSNNLTEEIYSRSLGHHSRLECFGNGPPLRLAIRTPGLLDTLHYVEDTALDPLLPDEVEVKVHAVGVNFKDLLLALGRVSGTTFGNECAGVVSRAGAETSFTPGDRVCLFTTAAFSTFVRAKAAGLAKVPNDVPLSVAASIPAQFGSAYYAIFNIARMQRGESILIHSGAGGTGQAAIQLAQILDAKIFVTVSSNKKRQFLIETYKIQEEHIFYSRNTDFLEGIRRLTNNRGVDVVLNSLSGEGLYASWDCIAAYGRFVELGKSEAQENAPLPMLPFLRNATFASFEGSVVAAERPALARAAIEGVLDLFSQGKAGPVKPLEVMSISDTAKALRALQSRNSIGKFVLEVTPDAMVPTILAREPTFHFDDKSTYVISGGLGGLGRSIARWMVQRGAKYLILLSRSGASSEEKISFLNELKSQGAVIAAPPCDITDAARLQSILEGCSWTMPPVKGCIQSASTLNDSPFELMSHSAWLSTFDPKTLGSWNLHALLSTPAHNLTFFILLSSITNIIGTPGQANYAAGNAYMDALAHHRIELGLPAAVLNLGAMVDDGMLVSNATKKAKALESGHAAQVTRPELEALLEYFCDPSRGVLGHDECQVVYGLNSPAQMRVQGKTPGHRLALPVFRHLFTLGDGGTGDSVGNGMQNDDPSAALALSFRKQLAAAPSLAAAGAALCRAIAHRLAHSLLLPGFGANDGAGGGHSRRASVKVDDGIDAAALDGSGGSAPNPDSSAYADTDSDMGVDLDKPLHSLGVDSLLAIELRTWLASEFGAELPVFEILGEGSFRDLGIQAAERSAVGRERWRGREGGEGGGEGGLEEGKEGMEEGMVREMQR